jgi:trigger factor
VQRPAQKGDLVEAEFSMSHEGKQLPDGEVKNYSAVLGEGLNFAPGFEEQILGLKENEEKNFSLLFPEDWLEKEMAGRLIDFKLKMKSVQEGQKPELNDEFAKSLGEFKDLEALKESIKEGLRHEKEHKEKDLWRLEILKEIAKKSEAEIPPILLEAEKEKMLAELEQNLAQMVLQFEKYLEDIKKTKDELKKEWSNKAEERVMAALILRQIARKEDLKIEEEELEKEANAFLARFRSSVKAEPGATGEGNQIDKERLKEYIKGSLLNEKVFRLLEDFSKQA